MPAWVQTGYEEYARRLTRDIELKLIELPLEKRSKNANIDKIKQQEAEALFSKCEPGGLIIALDERGKTWPTEQFAQHVKKWQEQYRSINLLIGGPDGLAASVRQQADLVWSLSPLTLPHPLVRIVVAEQVYRAYSLNSGHPYHRA